PPAGAAPDRLAPGEAPTPPAEPATGASGLAVELSKIGWGGSMLLPDLRMEGSVHGAKIARAEVRVVDARGNEIQRDRLQDVERFLARVADRDEPMSIRFTYEVDGKRMVLAKYPVSVHVTAYDTDGGTSEKVVEVDR
ncbi:MAG TPA: hypothetical protein VD788_05250, partial [Candidatus Polarisedimenticolaceae bacterium]|nr:hypothetical protein [Candidatus Polarisedimenticolaceae bacterium]